MELPDVPLFRGLTADEAEAAVTALRMRRRAFAKLPGGSDRYR